jgi:hypothetical protein
MKLSDFLSMAAAANPEQWMAFLQAESALTLTTSSAGDRPVLGTEEGSTRKQRADSQTEPQETGP